MKRRPQTIGRGAIHFRLIAAGFGVILVSAAFTVLPANNKSSPARWKVGSINQ